MLKGKLTYKDDNMGVVDINFFADDTFSGTRFHLMNDDIMNLENYRKVDYLFNRVFIEHNNKEELAIFQKFLTQELETELYGSFDYGVTFDNDLLTESHLKVYSALESVCDSISAVVNKLGTKKYREQEFFNNFSADKFFDLINAFKENDPRELEIYRSMQYLFTENGFYFKPLGDIPTSDYRRLDASKTAKFKTSLMDYEFASRLSGFLLHCNNVFKQNYNQQVQSKEDYFNSGRLVKLPEFGYIQYEAGLFKELSLRGKYIDIVMHETDANYIPEGIFSTFEQFDKYDNLNFTTPIANKGYRMSVNTLGFDYVPPIMETGVNLFGMYDTIEEVIQAHPTKNTSWILDRKYVIVTDANLESIIAEFMAYDGYIAFDTETTGLDINFKSRSGEADQLVGVVLSKEVGTGYYFPLQHKQFDNLSGGDHWYFMERYMKPLLEKKKIICHNLSFDWKVAYIYDIVVNCDYDTQLAFGVTKRYEDKNYETGLKALTRNLFGLDMFDLDDFVVGSSFSDAGITFADLPYEIVRQYAPTDGDMTLALKEYIDRHNIIEKYGAKRVFKMEVNFSKVVAYSEFYGYKVNTKKIPNMREEIVGGMERLKQKMFEMVGYEFNPASPQQLLKVMYEDLNIEVIGKKPSTNKDTLKALSQRTNENGEPKYPFVMLLKEFRSYEGIYKNFLKKLDQVATPDGYIFPGVFQLGTDTGRSSVKNPNYQSYNDPVKKNIVPRAGYYHFDCDFSQIEYRVLASMAGQEQLIAEFNDPDLDYHTYQASRMFSIPYSLVSKALRSQSKGVNFGLPYGMGDESLGRAIFGEKTAENTRKASMLRRKFFEGQEKIEALFERVRSEGVTNNFTSTYFGRRRYYNRQVFNESAIRRQAGNHVIQGTAADIYKESCNRLFNRIVKEGWLGLVLINAFVHDELLNEVHQSIDPVYFFKVWREEFQLEIDGFCDLLAGAGIGYNWYDAKKQDLPPQYIDDIIASYDPDRKWDGDIDKFMVEVEDGYEKYKHRRVREFITDPNNHGDVIKPLVYALLVEMSGKAVQEMQSRDTVVRDIKEINQLLGADLIPATGKHKLKTLKEYLTFYTWVEGIDMGDIVIKSPEEADVKVQTEVKDEPINIKFSSDSYTLADMLSLRGYFLDETNAVLYLTNRNMVYDGVNTNTLTYLYNKGVFKTEGEYQIALYHEETHTVEAYNAFSNFSDYQTVMRVYNMLTNTQLSFQPTVWR